MKINFKKTNSKAIIPTRATSESAGLDIYACLDKNHKQKTVNLLNIVLIFNIGCSKFKLGV